MKFRITIVILLIVGGFTDVFIWYQASTSHPTGSQSFMIYAGDNNPPSLADRQMPIPEALFKSDDERIKSMVNKAAAFQEKLMQVSNQLHLKWVGERGFSPASGTLSSSGASLQSSGAEFRFWLPSYQLTCWNNDQLELSFIKATDTPVKPPPAKPIWQKNQALKIGLIFQETLLDGVKVKMAPTAADFISEPALGSSGVWLLTWSRVDNHGYPFQQGQFKVKILEGYCPIEVEIPEITPYLERTDTPISLERASLIAHRDASATATTWTTPSSPEIVKGHLLWIFQYDDPKDFRGGEPVYIDAYTGETVGNLQP